MQLRTISFLFEEHGKEKIQNLRWQTNVCETATELFRAAVLGPTDGQEAGVENHTVPGPLQISKG